MTSPLPTPTDERASNPVKPRAAVAPSQNDPCQEQTEDREVKPDEGASTASTDITEKKEHPEINFTELLSQASAQTEFWDPEEGLHIPKANYTKDELMENRSIDSDDCTQAAGETLPGDQTSTPSDTV